MTDSEIVPDPVPTLGEVSPTPTPDPSPPANETVAAVPAVEAPQVEAEPTDKVTAPKLPAQPVPTIPPVPQSHDLARIAQDFQLRKVQVEAVVQLLDEGNTVPFITRYRKERTGGLDEEMIRRIQDRIGFLRNLAERKHTILKSIANQGKLTDPLVDAILSAEHLKRVEDLYLPFKPKKRTLASEARDKGLEPLAIAIWDGDPASMPLMEVANGVINPDKGLNTAEDVLTGVRHILAEVISERADVRGPLRAYTWDTALLVSNKVDNLPEGKGTEYREYFEFKEPVRFIPPHRVLAVNRGEKEQVIRVKFDLDVQRAKYIAADMLPFADHPHRDFLYTAIEDSVERLVLPSLEREIRRDLTDRAHDHAVHVFARNLRGLMMQPPMRGKRVLAIDPGLRTGCKVAALDETGALLEEAVIYPHLPHKKMAEAKRKTEQLIRKYQTPVIAIGNGTACRETEQFVSDMIAEFENRRMNPQPTVSDVSPVTMESTPVVAPVPEPTAPLAAGESDTVTTPTNMLGSAETMVVSPTLPGEASIVSNMVPVVDEVVSTSMPTTKVEVAPPPVIEVINLDSFAPAPVELAYVIVNEAGASDYSASQIAREEFPSLDATTRGTISIGRRLQDPLAELVKIDPQHVGVGLYQHDLKPKHLKESLESIVESCVNAVGVDVNTASVPLLRHISGLNQLVARELIEYRKTHGAFRSREQLKSVPQMGEARYTQAAGFLKITEGDEPLDLTWVHPESYPLARQILADLGFDPKDLKDKAKVQELHEKLKTTRPEDVAQRLKAGVPTVYDIFESLAKPGRDPREELPPPIFKKGILKIEDVQPGMELTGTVLNVVPFGAFVDIGVKESGLVHISQMANRYIKSPYDVVAVGDVVTVWVMEVKSTDKKISLTMIPPGQVRKPFGRQGGERGERGGERGEQREPRQQGQGQQGPPRGERPAPRREDRAPRPEGAPTGTPKPFVRGSQQPGRGPGPRRGPQQGQGQHHGGRPHGAPQTEAPQQGANPAAQPAGATPPPPRKPQRARPAVKLTDEKKTGKAALNTFGELAAFFRARTEPVPPPASAPAPEAKSESPPSETPAPQVETQSPPPDSPPSNG